MQRKSTADPINVANMPYNEGKEEYIARVLEFVEEFGFARARQIWNIYVFIKSVYGHAGLMFEAQSTNSSFAI